MLKIIEVKSKKDYSDFVNLVFNIYKKSYNYILPFKKDEIKALKAETNPSFKECDAKFWIIKDDELTIGRIGVIINHNYNSKMGTKTGRFTRFECVNKQDIANLLFDTAENWLKENGIKTVYGPLGFNNLDPQGLLIEGYEYTQSLGSTYHPPYYRSLIENSGYIKDIDWIEYKLELTNLALKKAEKGAKLISNRYNAKIINFKSTKELMPYTEDVFNILNKSFTKLHYVSTFNEDLKKYYTDKYFKLLNPEYIKLVTIEDNIAGFYVSMPSMFNALSKIKGQINIFNFHHLLKARKAKNTNTLEQLLGGVMPEYMNTGVAVLLINETHKLMLNNGLKYIETTGMFEDNINILKNWKSYKKVNEKRRRAYKKHLN